MTSLFERMRFQRLAKEGSWVVMGQVAAVAGSLVQVRVLTEYLTSAEYGRLALGLTAAGLINQAVTSGITASIGRFYTIAAEKKDVAGYLQDSRRLLTYGTMAVATVGLVLAGGLRLLGYSQWTGLVMAALLFSLLGAYNSSLSGIQNAARQRRIVAFHSGLDAWLKIVFAIGIIAWLGATSTPVVIGFICSALLVTASQVFFLRRTILEEKPRAGPAGSWLRQMWAYAWPFSVFGIFTWMQQASDRWAMEGFSSTEDVGLYSVLFQLGYAPIGIVSALVMSLVAPILFQRSGDTTDASRNANVHRLGWTITFLSLAVTGLGFVFTFALHEQIFKVLVATEYRRASYLLPWVVLAGGLFAAGQMLALKLMSEMRPAAMTFAKVATALMGIAFNIIGAAWAGLSGVVGALVAFSVIYLGWMTLLGRRQK